MPMELADLAAESVIVFDMTGVAHYANGASTRMYGPMLGQEVRGFDSLQRDDQFGPAWRDVLAAGGWTGILDRSAADGAAIATTVRLTVRSNADGPVDVVEYSAPIDFGTATPAHAPSPRRLDRTACWQFNIAGVTALLSQDASTSDARIAGNAVGRPDRLENFLGAIQILDINETAIRLFDLPADRDRLIARPIINLWPEQSLEILAELIEALATDAVDGAQTRRIATMGRLTDVVLTGWRAGDKRCGDTVFISVSATLNTSGALLELQASQDRYRSMISSLPMPIWQIDSRAVGRIFERLAANGVTDMAAYVENHPELVDLANDIVLVSEVNDEAVKMMGASHRSQLIAPVGYFFTATPEAGRNVMLAQWSGVRNHVEAMKIQTFDGRLQDVLLLVTFPVPGERLDTTIVSLIDDTARLQTEAKLRQIEADFTRAARLSTLGELAASIAHEVKQPLSAILTNAETSLRWISRDELNLPKIQQLTERIAESARRGNDIINRIQDMAGKRTPVRTSLDFNEVVGQAVSFVRHDSDEKSITVRQDLGEDIPRIVGDRVQLQQIVVNLLVNSIQAMTAASSSQPTIEITTRAASDGANLTIRDTGPGIPRGDLERVFEGFFSTKEAGMGIGLAICQSIIAAHGGTITASNHPEGGARFHVSVPLATHRSDAAEIKS